MSTASFDLSKLPKALQPGGQMIDTAKPCKALAEAGRFEGGQMSGPFGPKFVGFGPMPKLTLRERFGGTVVIALAIAALSALLMAVR